MHLVQWYVACLTGPQLYYTYLDGNQSPYEGNYIERLSDPLIRFFTRFRTILILCSPVCIFLPLGVGGFIVPGFLVVLFIMYLLRGIGRVRSPVYRKFITDLRVDIKQCREKMCYETTKIYDFDISVLPPLYSQNESKLCPEIPNQPKHHFDWLLAIVLSCFVYPGSVRFTFYRKSKDLSKSRYNIVSNYNGIRARLRCNSRQLIDTMYAAPARSKDNILVIACKGNYSFYESRGMTSWITRGYACIGWNHCGYGYSTGSPTGRQEKEAIITIVSYAVEVLNYPIDNILLHGNSIGGFTACFACAAFPSIRGLILESSFDDLNSLVPALVPRFLPRNLIKLALRYCYDLNNIVYLLQYKGPLTLIRKTNDTLMRSEAGNLGSNRTNFLLLEVMKERFSDLFVNEDCFEVVKIWLNADHEVRNEIEKGLDKVHCVTHLTHINSTTTQNLSEDFKKELAVFIATQYMKNQKSAHSTNIGARFYKPPLHIPWNN